MTNYPIDIFNKLHTPFYYYDLDLFSDTLNEIKLQDLPPNYFVHYALKANSNEEILMMIKDNGFGVDCVSGGELELAVRLGFSGNKIVFAGVGKADWEINFALDSDINCFNVESIQELEVINDLAAQKNKIANIALRINPNVDAATHKYITTGLSENKFGIEPLEINKIMDLLPSLHNLHFIGLHFHIGSQISDMDIFRNLCLKINYIQDVFKNKGINMEYINVGGGLGINYESPDTYPIVDFSTYFQIFREHLNLNDNQSLHFELGRSLVANCGSLITKVLYIKESSTKKFVIVDAGLSDLIRPALYSAYHKIENMTSQLLPELYDVVGPICESSDVFASNLEMNRTKRGDILLIRSAGAYGEVMASSYNLRKLPKAFTSRNIHISI